MEGGGGKECQLPGSWGWEMESVRFLVCVVAWRLLVYTFGDHGFVRVPLFLTHFAPVSSNTLRSSFQIVRASN